MGSALLLLIAEDINVPVRLVSLGNVESLRLLAELVKLLDGLLVEFNLLEVRANASWGNRLGDDNVVVEGGPGEDDLGGCDLLALGLAEALSNSLDLRSVDEERLAPAVVTESGVSSQDDALLLHVFDKLGLREARVTLDLVHGGGYTGVLNDLFKLMNGLAL